jgi:transcriptional regulator with XRE-family HTH domain
MTTKRENLIRARESKGLSVTELGGLTGTHRANIYALERGARNASKPLRMLLAIVLERPEDELFPEDAA